MTTIKFNDGYTVGISDSGILTRTHQGKKVSCHVTHFRAVPEGSKAEKVIIEHGNKPDDYLFADTGLQKLIVRAGNGVRQAVATLSEEIRKENAEKNAKFEADRLARIAAGARETGLSDPVLVVVEYWDGYPTKATIEGVEVPIDEVKPGGRFSFVERALVDASKAAAAEREKAAEAEKARKAAALQALFAQAKLTGKPVEIARWTTDRCMNRHDNECSFDNALKVAMPDGTVKTTYTCCY